MKIFTPIIHSFHQTSLSSLCLFEIRSLIGRIFMNRKPPEQKDLNYLNLGCGLKHFKGWVNSDFYYGLLPWNTKKSKIDWKQDFRFKLNCIDEHWDGVFSEHTLEHLYPDEAFNLLKEIRRSMKTGKWLRISVPDLEKYIRFYNNTNNNDFRKKWKLGSEAIVFLTQNWGHHSVWDYKLLSLFLLNVGFRNINKVSYGKGTEKTIIKDSPKRRWESLYVEAQK